jgi:hypothetical protein
MKGLSTLRRDYIASHLRYQLATLRSVIDDIENSNRVEESYVDESLKRVAANLSRLRKLCHKGLCSIN